MPILKCNGFAFISVMIFLHIFSLIGLYSMTTAALALKNSHHVWLHDKNHEISSQILSELAMDVLGQMPGCLIKPMSPATLAKQPKFWWQLTGCAGEKEGSRYFYVLEALGADPCAVIAHNSYRADYYRLTLLFYPANFAGTKIILQSTIVLPKLSRGACRGLLHPVKIGEQMQRQIS